MSVLAWRPGSTTAAVSVQPFGDPPFAGVLDLVTGKVTQVDGYAPYLWSRAFLNANGDPVWTGNDATSAYVTIAADGTQSAYTIPASVGAAELAKAKSGATGCGVAAPYDDTSVLATCSFDASGQTQAVMRVWPDTGEVQTVFGVANDGKLGFAPTRAGDFVVGQRAPAGEYDCPTTYESARGGATAPVPGIDKDVVPGADIFYPLGAVGNQFVWWLSSECSSDPKPLAVVSSDLAAGTYAVLMPLPGDRPAREEPFQSVTGVAVAH